MRSERVGLLLDMTGLGHLRTNGQLVYSLTLHVNTCTDNSDQMIVIPEEDGFSNFSEFDGQIAVHGPVLVCSWAALHFRS